GAGPPIVDRYVSSLVPAELPQSLHECRRTKLPLGIIADRLQHSDPPHALTLLRPRRSRPRRRAAEQRDELAPPDHSITSSARASSVSGTAKPSAFAVLRLITKSYLVGACTGRSDGFSPRRMRST